METRGMRTYTGLKAKSILLAFVAVFAISAAMSAAASAAKPEFKPVPTKKKFTISGGTSKWVSGTSSITCAKSSTTGEIDGATSVGNVVSVYSGCKSKKGSEGAACPVNSVGGKAEEIATYPLDGELGTVATSQAPSGVGLRFKESPEGEVWFTLQKNKCTVEGVFQGGLAAEVSVIGKKQATNKLAFSLSGIQQKIEEITLDSGVVEKPRFAAFGSIWTVEASNELTFEEPVEVT